MHKNDYHILPFFVVTDVCIPSLTHSLIHSHMGTYMYCVFLPKRLF